MNMERKNCWEVMKCGREPDGNQVDDLGVCSAALPSEYDGMNGGVYAGRFCWSVAGTLCGGKIQGTFADKLMSCLDCEFLKKVNNCEGRYFTLTFRKPSE